MRGGSGSSGGAAVGVELQVVKAPLRATVLQSQQQCESFLFQHLIDGRHTLLQRVGFRQALQTQLTVVLDGAMQMGR